jgi:hypothetical protein
MNPYQESLNTLTNTNLDVSAIPNDSQHYSSTHNERNSSVHASVPEVVIDTFDQQSNHDMIGTATARLPMIHSYSDITNLGTYLPEHSPENDLLTLVQSYAWSATLRRISTHPSEATSVGEQGRTPLHVACDHDAPAFVIHALLKANPCAATMVGTSDMNPLHITCSSQHASVEVVRVLLDQSENKLKVTAMKDVDGDTSLHAACRCGAPIQVIEVLLRANPSLVHDRDYEGLTPLLRLWVRYFVTLGDDTINGVCTRGDVKGELAEAWSKTELLLRAAYHGSIEGYDNEGTCNGDSGNRNFDSGGVGDECVDFHQHHIEKPEATKTVDAERKAACKTSTVNEFQRKKSQAESLLQNDFHGNEFECNISTNEQRLLNDKDQAQHVREPLYVIHAASAIDCPRAVVKIATVLYPQQLDDHDLSGRTPLMIAAMAPIFKEHDLSDEGYSLEELIHGDDVNTTEYNHDDYTEQKQPTVIDVLLEAGADARIAGHSNFKRSRIPLHSAIVSGKRWNEGLKILRDSYPDSLMKLDVKTGLYPFMLAAATGCEEEASEITTDGRCYDLDTIFEILRSLPGIISNST